MGMGWGGSYFKEFCPESWLTCTVAAKGLRVMKNLLRKLQLKGYLINRLVKMLRKLNWMLNCICVIQNKYTNINQGQECIKSRQNYYGKDINPLHFNSYLEPFICPPESCSDSLIYQRL